MFRVHVDLRLLYWLVALRYAAVSEQVTLGVPSEGQTLILRVGQVWDEI